MGKDIRGFGTALLIVLALFIGIFFGYQLSIMYNNHNKKINTTKQRNLFELNDSNVVFWLDYFDIQEKEIVYQQIMLETGYLQSDICLRQNNLIGLYNGSEFYSFSHYIESIIFYKYRIQNRYNPKKENYYQFLHRIGYAKDFHYINKLK